MYYSYKSPEQIVHYIQELHKAGWQKIKRKDTQLILNHSMFILKEISLENTDIKWTTFPCHYDSAVKYSKLKTDLPPIVIDSEGKIIDGEHRSVAAKLKGQKIIKAYVGIK